MASPKLGFVKEGWTMRIIGFFLIIVLAVITLGCASFQRSQVIDTDKLQGYASGTYRDDSAGRTGSFDLVGSGAAWGGGGSGLGAVGMGIRTGPPPSGALDFARAIAMINYSKKLKSIKYDQYGGVIDYEFEQTSLAPKNYSGSAIGSGLPSSFGHQPVE
jgi:hypothetical protein